MPYLMFHGKYGDDEGQHDIEIRHERGIFADKHFYVFA